MKHQIELRHLRYFEAVAEQLHFGRAAERLFISQPGLSRQVKQLEESLGVQLFYRDNRNVQLTEAGKFLKTEVSLQLKHLERILTHTQLLAAGLEGELKFAYLGSAMQKIIPDLLLEFRSKYPKVHFYFKEMDNQQQVDKLLNQEIDIGFVRLERVPKDLVLQGIDEDTFSLVLPEDHPMNAEHFKNLKQLEDEPFILFERSYSPNYFEKIQQIFDYSGFVPKVNHQTVNASTIYKLVEHQFGVSIVPTSLKTGYDMRVKFIELKDIPQRTILSAVWSRRNRNPSLERFRQLL